MLETYPHSPSRLKIGAKWRTSPKMFDGHDVPTSGYRMVLMKVFWNVDGEVNLHHRDIFRWFPALRGDLTASGASFGIEYITKPPCVYALTAFSQDRKVLDGVRERWWRRMTALQVPFQSRTSDGLQIMSLRTPSRHESDIETFFQYRVDLSPNFPDFALLKSQMRGPFYFATYVDAFRSWDLLVSPWHWKGKISMFCSNHYDAVLARMMDEP